MGRKVTAADIQVEIAKGAFRPHTALSNMALSRVTKIILPEQFSRCVR